MSWEEDLLQLNDEAMRNGIKYVNARHYYLCRRAVQTYGSVHRALKSTQDKQNFEREYQKAYYAKMQTYADPAYVPLEPITSASIDEVMKSLDSMSGAMMRLTKWDDPRMGDKITPEMVARAERERTQWDYKWGAKAIADMWGGPRPESYKVWVTRVVVDTVEVEYSVKVNLTKERVDHVEAISFSDMDVTGEILEGHELGIIILKGESRLLRYEYSLSKIRACANFQIEDFTKENGRPRELDIPITKVRKLDTNFDIKLDDKAKN